jgi:hypothetical protein
MADPGPIEATTEALLRWVGGIGLSARHGPPAAQEDPPDVHVWLVELLPEQELRRGSGGTSEPVRFRMRYLLTTGRPDDLGTLDRLLSATVHGPFHAVFDSVPVDVWQLLGTPPRPAFFTDVVGHLDRPLPVRPRVAGPLRVVITPTTTSPRGEAQ